MSKAPLARSADLKYYSFDKVMSYNGIYTFCVGARGLGKTYGAKKMAIRNAIRHNRQFIYLRRYKTEIANTRMFFNDVAWEFPEYDFRVEGRLAQMAPVSTRDVEKRVWQTIGYMIALSNAQTQKSVPYPDVTIIIYDEFIIEEGSLRYLTDEAKIFNDFYLTVDRWKDKTRVLFLANSLTITNPYFLEYGILPDEEKPEELMVKYGGVVVVHLPDSAEFSEGVYRTRFGQFIQNTTYADYAVGNEFADNHSDMVGGKTSTAEYMMTLETKHAIFSVWVDWRSDPTTYYVQDKRPKRERICTMLPGKMGPGKRLIERSDKRLQYLRAAFSQGRVYFDTPRTRNAFVEIYKR